MEKARPALPATSCCARWSRRAANRRGGGHYFLLLIGYEVARGLGLTTETPALLRWGTDMDAGKLRVELAGEKDPRWKVRSDKAGSVFKIALGNVAAWLVEGSKAVEPAVCHHEILKSVGKSYLVVTVPKALTRKVAA